MSTDPVQTTVLIVDDDDVIRSAIARILQNCGCMVSEAKTVEDALSELNESQYDLVFCDMRFKGGLGGEDLLSYTNEHMPTIAVVLISCAMDAQRSRELVAQGAAMCIQKPFFKETCLNVLGQLKHKHQNAA